MKKYKFKTKPFDHQITALDKSWDKKVYALFMEMGTGKTKVTHRQYWYTKTAR
jgi:hypothetical protein